MSDVLKAALEKLEDQYALALEDLRRMQGKLRRLNDAKQQTELDLAVANNTAYDLGKAVDALKDLIGEDDD